MLRSCWLTIRKYKYISLLSVMLTLLFHNRNGMHFHNETVMIATSSTASLTDQKVDTTGVAICTHAQRRDYLQRMCKATEKERLQMQYKPRSRFIVDDKRRVLYCEVSKAACSTWKSILMDHALNTTTHAHTDARGIHGAETYRIANLTLTGGWRPEYNSYRKILLVRHPLDRFISAFYNLKHFKQNTGMHGPGGEVRSDLLASFKLPELINLTLTDFVRYVTRPEISGKHYYDRHFDSYAKTCRVCDIDYDYIVRTETMNADVLPVLKDLGFSEHYWDDLKLSHGTRPSSVNDGAGNLKTAMRLTELQNLSQAELDQLISRYYFDFQLFGYTFDGHEKASCEMSFGENKNCC